MLSLIQQKECDIFASLDEEQKSEVSQIFSQLGWGGVG